MNTNPAHMTGINKMRSYVLVSMLAVVSGQCTKTHSGLTQCTILNGAPTKDTGMMSLLGFCLHTTRLSFMSVLRNVCPACLPFETDQLLPPFERGHFCWSFCSADAAAGPAYEDQVKKGTLTDSPTCKTAYNAYNCIMLANIMDSAPCDALGASMLPCYDLCTAYMLACKMGGGTSTMAPSPKNLAFSSKRVSLSCYAQ